LAQESPRQVPVPPPPLGWSSWNGFSNLVNSRIVMEQAHAMATNGMQKAGYEYINIDEGWWLGKRDKDGNIVVEPGAWPAISPEEHDGDMSNIVRYIHGLGLKAGIYTDAGRDGCSTTGPDLGPSYPNTGSEGHYEQDFLQFAKWGFDYVKVDWCGGNREHLDPAIQYGEIARAILRAEAITGHTLYYSICNGGGRSPSSWAPGIGEVRADIWRTGGDIVAPIVANSKNANRKAEFKEVLREFDQAQHPEAQHTGFYNDPDMMVAGMAGLTDQQSRMHVSLWAISGGPLLVGADLTRLSATTLAALTNPDILRIDQDSLGLQSMKVSELEPGLQVWSKPLSKSGERAVLLLNRSSESSRISVAFRDLGLQQDIPAKIHEVWGGKDLGEFRQSYETLIPAGDGVLLRILGKEIPFKTYSAESQHGREVVFSGVASRFGVAVVRIAYINPDKAPRFAELRANGQAATRIAFPPTGDASAAGEVSIEARMDGQGETNRLTFILAQESLPKIQSISVQ
jgi:hypothetical protein